jgi:hypothetical protein
MAALAGDLSTWLERPALPAGLDEVAALGAELRRRAAPHIEVSDAAEREGFAVHALYERIEAALEPVTSSIRAAFPNVGSPNAGELVQLLQSHPALGGPAVRIRYAAGATVREYAEMYAHTLHYAALVEHPEGGSVRAGLAITLGRDGEHADDVWVEARGSAPVESLAAERLVDAAAAELIRRVPDGLRRFLARIE